MAREYARVKLAIWADGDFRSLTDAAQALYFRLLTSPTMSLCGVADWRPKRLVPLTSGMTVKAIEKTARELIDTEYILTDDDTEEVLVRSFIRHDGLIKTPNIAAAMVKDYAGTASALLRGVIIYELRRLHDDEPEMKGWSTASKLLSEPAINPSDNPSVMASPIPSGNGSHIPQPASLNQQPLTTHSRRPSSAAADGPFDEFWTAYPRKVGKDDARRVFRRRIKDTDTAAIIAGAKRLAADPNLPEKQFIPHPATWLQRGGWDDEPLPAPVTNGGRVEPERPGFWNEAIA